MWTWPSNSACMLAPTQTHASTCVDTHIYTQRKACIRASTHVFDVGEGKEVFLTSIVCFLKSVTSIQAVTLGI